jgi:cytochrome c553
MVLVCFALPSLIQANPSDGVTGPRVPSNVAWTPETIKLASRGDAFRGLLLSRHCGHCHGAEGFSSDGSIPNLAGMDRLSIWKQLQDFRAGKRTSAVMQPIASVLSAQDHADIAAYYSMLPIFSDPQDNRSFPQAAPEYEKSRVAQKLIVFGNASRGIPPCQACHGPVGYLKGAASLATQNASYLLNQLQHFSDGSRANDINVAMREIARQLSAEERAALSEYYGAGRGESSPSGRAGSQNTSMPN